MSTNNFFKSDLYGIHNIIQASMLVYPKEIIIATLRDFFSKDSYYHYSKDQWGFANTTDHTDLAPGADLPSGFGSHPELSNVNPLSTRLFIGENYRYDGIYYPAILIKSGGGKYVPISINREQGGVQYENIVFEDGYGNQSVVSKPISFITAGAWEGSITIDVMTRSLRSRDDLVELVAMCFTEVNFDTLVDVGVIIKPISYSSPSESDDRNDKLFRQSLTLDIRTEWRREIPVGNIIDAIFFTAIFEDLSRPAQPIPANLTINTEVSVLDMLLKS
jgi:hypothetical protein